MLGYHATRLRRSAFSRPLLFSLEEKRLLTPTLKSSVGMTIIKGLDADLKVSTTSQIYPVRSTRAS
jgi:hypothetical protein